MAIKTCKPDASHEDRVKFLEEAGELGEMGEVGELGELGE